MLTEVIEADPAVLENVLPLDVDVSETVSGRMVGLPFAASSVTVIGPMLVVDDAVPELTVEENTSLVGLSRIVSVWVADVKPVAEVVIVGVPGVLSP